MWKLCTETVKIHNTLALIIQLFISQGKRGDNKHKWRKWRKWDANVI
jgi:hypothetical protein